jgi:hypothetical protein
MNKTMKNILSAGTAIAAVLTFSTADVNAASIFYDMVKSKHITFEAAAPKTITDNQWQGTGFTHRLPGTGSSLLKNDANLSKEQNGLLAVKSTYSDINVGGVNLNNMETLAVPLNDIGRMTLPFL